MAQAKVMQAVVEIAGNISPTLASSINSAQKSLNGLNLQALAIGTAVASAVIATSKYLVDLGGQFDEATDNIRIGTGATGDDLDALMDSFDNVFGAVPASMEDTSKAIADYNTRLGLTGKQLEDISTQALRVSEMLGDDLGTVIESSSKAFTNWSLASEDYSEAMDYAFKVSQSTGIGFSKLLSEAEQYGAQLQAVGYDFEEALTLLGKLDKAGLDASAVMTGLRNAANVATKAGFSSVSEGLEVYYQRIKDAESETRALQMASAMFGSRSAPIMVKAIKDGTLSLTELKNALDESTESIGKATEDTYDFPQMFGMLANQGKLALKPLADSLYNILNIFAREVYPTVSRLLQKLGPLLEGLGKILNGLGTLAGANLHAIMSGINLILDAYEALGGAFSKILEGDFSGALDILSNFFKHAWEVIIEPFEKVADWFAEKFGGAWKAVMGVFSSNGNVFQGISYSILETFMGVVNGLIKGINAVVTIPFAGINVALEKLRGVSILGTTPFDWIPTIPTPQIPMLAKGGMTDGISIAGEAGREAVISFDRTVRDRNINLWVEAGQMLGILPPVVGNELSYEGQAAKLMGLEDFSLSDIATGGGDTYVTYDFSGFTYSPNIEASGSDSDSFMDKMRSHEAEFFDWLRDFTRMKEVACFG